MEIPKGKYCEGCPYLDTMLYYNCQMLRTHVGTDGEARHVKTEVCLLSKEEVEEEIE